LRRTVSISRFSFVPLAVVAVVGPVGTRRFDRVTGSNFLDEPFESDALYRNR
jgi:hypothetical protein